jgi:hypothetical protein
MPYFYVLTKATQKKEVGNIRFRMEKNMEGTMELQSSGNRRSRKYFADTAEEKKKQSPSMSNNYYKKIEF